jgi:catechol 2,3-dioxygenase-like lactoylglutathione lyase family enzyme
MAELNHTIVWCSDQEASAAYLTGILGLPPAKRFSHFHVVEMANGLSLDFATKAGPDPVSKQHYAFLVSEAEFDAAFARITANGQEYWADPARTRSGQINRQWGGKGVYFLEPDGHVLELITKPYGDEKDL